MVVGVVVGVVVGGGGGLVVGGLVVGGLVVGGAVGGGEVGAGVVAAGCWPAVVGVMAGVDGGRVVVFEPAATPVVVGAATGVAETFTTNHFPETPCPAVEPAVLSPLKVYSGDPL